MSSDPYTNFDPLRSYPESVSINDLLTRETIQSGDEQVNLLLNILLGILPQIDYKENFKEIFKAENFNDILLKYLNDICTDLLNKAILEGLTYKLSDNKNFVKQIQSLPLESIFRYSDKNMNDFSSSKAKIDIYESTGYSRMLKIVLEESILKAKPIENNYASIDDLLYDIYLAGQYLTFFAIFSPVVFKEIFLGKNLNYSEIINLFHQTPDNEIFTTSLLKEKFKLQVMSRENFLKMKEKPLYVTEELSYPQNLSQNIFYNITFQKRQERLKDLQKIYTLFAFLEKNVKAEIESYLRNLNTDQSSSKQVDNFFQTPQAYKDHLEKELNDLKINTLSLFSVEKNPLIEKISELNVESASKVQKDFDILLAEDPKKFELTVHRAPIDLKDIRRHPMIDISFLKNQMDKKYDFLSPTSTEHKFTIDKLFFPSIAHYSIFKLFQNFLNVSKEEAYRSMSKSEKELLTYEEYKTQFESKGSIIIRNRFARSTIYTLKLWYSNPKNTGKLPENKNLVFESENGFLGSAGFNFIGKFLMVLKNGLKEVKDQKILLWFDNKLADMTSAIRVYKEPLDQQRFLENLFRFPSECGNIKIILKDREADDKNKIVFEYLSNFIASCIIQFGEKGFVENIGPGKRLLQKTDMTKARFYDDFPKMCIALRSTFEKSNATPDELSSLLTVICKSEMKVKDIDDAWKAFSTIEGLTLNRYNFFSLRLLPTYNYIMHLAQSV